MIGTTVYVRDDNGTQHAGTVTDFRQMFGPFRRYEIVIADTGQVLHLFPEHFSTI